jgi:hypothetical protein
VRRLTGWEQVRRKAQRKGRWRAWCVLGFLPVALAAFLGYIETAWWDPYHYAHDLGLADHSFYNRYVLGFIILFLILPSVIFGTAVDLSAFHGDPIVMRGEIVEITEWGDIPFAAPVRALFGYGLVVNVKKAARIGRDGWSEDRDLLGDGQRVRSTQRLNRRMTLKQEVFLVCNATERAVATLSDLYDDAVVTEFRAILDTGPAPEPAAAAEPES